MPKSGKHPEKKLTAIGVKALCKPGRYADGGGLYLVVDPSGAKRWVSRILVHGVRRDIGLGGITTTPLAEAREKALEIRKVARNGGDPVADRRAARRPVPTFVEAVERVHAEQKKGWKSLKHAEQWATTLRTYAVPFIGAKRINSIDSSDIVRILEPIWIDKAETARRIHQRLNVIMRWAKVNGFRSGDNPVEGAELALARQNKAKNHFAALNYDEIPTFVASIGKCGAGEMATLAFEFLILTAVRTKEVRGARWSEIDITKGTWTVPADRTKSKKEHRVPLGPRCLAILERVRSLCVTSDFVFPGRDSRRALGVNIFDAILDRMRVPVTVHGFRSTFRDWASETTAFPNEVCEMALAHVVANKVEAAYRRGDLFEKRRELMLAWEVFVYRLPKSG